MKLEIEKESNGIEVWFHILRDGVHIDGTYTKDPETASSLFEKCKVNPIAEKKKEIIKSEEI